MNKILIFLNFLVLILLLFIPANKNYLLDGEQLLINLLIFLSIISLLINYRVNNFFLHLLNLYFSIFFIFRIPFLYINGFFSDIVLRKVSSDDIHFSLLVLVYSYVSLVISILILNPRLAKYQMRPLDNNFIKIILHISTLAIILHSFYFLNKDTSLSLKNNFYDILRAVFDMYNIILVLIVLLLTQSKSALKKYKLQILILILLVLILSIFAGSKSGFLNIALLIYIVSLFFNIKLLNKSPIILIVGFFGAGLLSIFLYFLGNSFKFYQRELISFDEIKIHFFNNIQEPLFVINSFSSRFGHLDFFIEKLSNPLYKPYISFDYYFMAIFDRLTPFFDFFGDSPFISRLLFSAREGTQIIGNASEQITIFAEYYLIFGFFSPIFFFLSIWVFKFFIEFFNRIEPKNFPLYNIFLAESFFSFINSYGLDMLVVGFFYKILFVFLLIKIVKI
jgi:hypothetical protein